MTEKKAIKIAQNQNDYPKEMVDYAIKKLDFLDACRQPDPEEIYYNKVATYQERHSDHGEDY
jgi:hypothetical protein